MPGLHGSTQTRIFIPERHRCLPVSQKQTAEARVGLLTVKVAELNILLKPFVP